MAFAHSSSPGDVVSTVADAELKNDNSFLVPKAVTIEAKAPKNAELKEEQLAVSASPIKALIEIPKNPTEVNVTTQASVCCYSAASTEDDAGIPITKDQNSDEDRSGKCLPSKTRGEMVRSSGMKDCCPQAMVKEYQVNNTSGALESLVKEVYDAEGRMIWYKIITGTRKSPGRTSQEGESSASGPLCKQCRKPGHEGEAIRKVASIPPYPVQEKPEASRPVPQRIEGTEERGRVEEPEKRSKKGKAALSVPAKGESSLEPSTVKSIATGPKESIARTVLQFLGEFERQTIKSNRMREKNVLRSHHDVVKLFLIFQGFLILAFVFLTIVCANVAAFLFIVLFATR